MAVGRRRFQDDDREALTVRLDALQTALPAADVNGHIQDRPTLCLLRTIIVASNVLLLLVRFLLRGLAQIRRHASTTSAEEPSSLCFGCREFERVVLVFASASTP